MAGHRRFSTILLALGLAAALAPAATAQAEAAKGGQQTATAQVVVGGPVPGAPWVELSEGTKPPTAVGALAVQASSLPFNYTFDFSASLNSRTFWPSGGRACVNLRVTGSNDSTWYGRSLNVEMRTVLGIKVGPTVGYVADGLYRGYCWSGLNSANDHYFRIVKNWGGSTRVWGDGSVTG